MTERDFTVVIEKMKKEMVAALLKRWNARQGIESDKSFRGRVIPFVINDAKLTVKERCAVYQAHGADLDAIGIKYLLIRHGN